MTKINIALLGYGTVGKGVYQTIKEQQSRFKALLGKEVKITAVLVKNTEKHQLSDKDVILTSNFTEIIEQPGLNVIIDAIVGREPAYSYLQKAIKKGCHVITANKEMFAHYGGQLLSLAANHNVSIGYEATVAGGIPVIQTLKRLLNVNRITKVEGILNGTSNFILTKMREDRLSFAQALSQAQKQGFAEADPTNDIEGYDAFYKTMILSRTIFQGQPEWDDVLIKGITGITSEQIDIFSSLGLRFKHVASLKKTNEGINASVKPVLVGQSHPLYQVENVQNAVSIEADIVGSICLQGPGAGMFPTASAIVEDLIHIGDSDFARRYPEAGNSESEQTYSNWVVTGEIDQLELQAKLENTSVIQPNILLVKAAEEEIRSIEKSYPGLACYEIYGEYDLTKKIYHGLLRQEPIIVS